MADTAQLKREVEHSAAEARVVLIDQIIAALPEEQRREENPVKSCANCYNFGKTCLSLGLYWADRRCKYCFDDKDYGSWSHVLKLRNECISDLLHPVAPDTFSAFVHS